MMPFYYSISAFNEEVRGSRASTDFNKNYYYKFCKIVQTGSAQAVT
jgi:hypothetical protein